MKQVFYKVAKIAKSLHLISIKMFFNDENIKKNLSYCKTRFYRLYYSFKNYFIFIKSKTKHFFSLKSSNKLFDTPNTIC